MLDFPNDEMATPYVFYSEPEVTSTQDLARAAYEGMPVVYTAERQTQGRGRRGAPWLTADEALAVSVAFGPSWPSSAWPRFSLAAGLSAAVAVDRLMSTVIELKWPNDLMIEGRKVGGVLAEAGPDLVVIGVGLNLVWERPPEGMGALATELPRPRIREEIARTFAADLLTRASGPPEAWGRDEYVARCQTIGRTVSWQPAGRGHVVGVDDEGALVVDTDRGRITLRSGAVAELRDVSDLQSDGDRPTGHRP